MNFIKSIDPKEHSRWALTRVGYTRFKNLDANCSSLQATVSALSANDHVVWVGESTAQYHFPTFPRSHKLTNTAIQMLPLN